MGLEFWRVGQTTPRAIGVDAPQLERDGWDGLLIADSQCVIGDSYVALAIAAQATSTIGLGVGVTNPVTRHPSVTASAAAGVQELSGGRVVLGIGRGDSSLAHIGLAPASPAVFENYVRTVRTYLGGGPVPFDQLDRAGHRPSTELGGAGIPEESRLRWLNPDVPRVPVDVAASGPAAIGVAARHADRVTFGVGADHERLSWAIETARAARADAGLDPATLSMGAYVNVVAHPDEGAAITLANDETGAQTEAHQKFMMGEIDKLAVHHRTAKMLSGEQATVAAVLKALDGAKLAHIAAHGAHELPEERCRTTWWIRQP